MYYKSETYNLGSTPKTGKVYGTHNIVEIKDGKGEKVKEALNASGAVLERKVVKLKPAEMEKILAGRFVGGLWKNCTLKNCAARHAKRGVSRKRSGHKRA
jgi:hypothetical protein